MINTTFAATAKNHLYAQIQHINMEVFNIVATIFLIGLVMIFVLAILKRMLEYRIKNKIADKGISEDLAASLLQPSKMEEGSINIKWFCILVGVGAGLTIIYYTLPLGIHSMAIMSFSMAISFLGYHIYLKSINKESN